MHLHPHEFFVLTMLALAAAFTLGWRLRSARSIRRHLAAKERQLRSLRDRRRREFCGNYPRR